MREPLVVFLALGLAVFALERLNRGGLNDEQRQIEITARELDRLRELWNAQSGRPPTDSELEALVEDAIEEEILVREARRLGLDHNDTIVRRRLAQKMTFLIQDTAELETPSERDLEQFFEQSLERYVEPARVTFSHVFFSNERRGDTPSEEARKTLAELRKQPESAESSSWRRLGDPFLLNREYAERTEQELAELFGRDFAAALVELEVGGWQGPVASAYGQHLVRITKKSESRQLALDEVRSRVLDDFRADRRRQANRDELDRLRRRYRVTVEPAKGLLETDVARGSAP